MFPYLIFYETKLWNLLHQLNVSKGGKPYIESTLKQGLSWLVVNIVMVDQTFEVQNVIVFPFQSETQSNISKKYYTHDWHIGMSNLTIEKLILTKIKSILL